MEQVEMKTFLLQHLSSSSSANISSLHHHGHNQFPLSQSQQTQQLSATHHTQLHHGLSASTAITSHHTHIPSINSSSPLLTSAAAAAAAAAALQQQQHRNTSPSISGPISGTSAAAAA
ncbi:unnamed protein product, partial [Anisakis simplex]|uniref:Uncharacterized protein n=1 Tax=Anisakis simplex TaxID=6269 RepID=A0A0M3JBU6_ANISI